MAKKAELTEKKASPFRTASKNLPFHDFQKEPELICRVDNKLILGESEPFEVFEITDVLTGEKKFLTNSYSIGHAVEKCKAESRDSGNNFTDYVFQFKFLEKTLVKGKPFNKIDCGYCTFDEYQDSL